MDIRPYVRQKHSLYDFHINGNFSEFDTPIRHFQSIFLQIRCSCARASFGSNRQQHTLTRRHRDRSRRPCIFVYSKQMHFISTPHDGDGQRNYRPFAPFLHLEINHPIKRRLRYCFCIVINIGHYILLSQMNREKSVYLFCIFSVSRV